MVANWKTSQVDSVAKKIKSRKVVGIVGISGIPSKQLQLIRKKLKDNLEIIVSRSTLLSLALEKAGIKELNQYLSGPSAIVVTDLNPFELEKIIYSNKTNAPAKAGAIAPFDLVVPAGDTGLAAGPVIGDLQAAGIKARIQGGKIMVTEESTLVKAGEIVSEAAAPVLIRLGIEPMEIILKLKAASEAGTVYAGDLLHVDSEKTIATLNKAYMMAFNLAYNGGVYTSSVMELRIFEAMSKARNLMINAKILNKETVGIYLARADAQAKSLKSVLPEELKPQEEPKAVEEAPKSE